VKTILAKAGIVCGLAGLGPALTPAAETEAGPPPAIVRAGPESFSIESQDGAYKLRLRGLLQVDGRAFADDGGLEGNDEFLVRRARIEITGTLARQFEFRLMPDFGGTSTTLLDAWIRWKLRAQASVEMGKIKSPVGLEREQARESNLFAEFGYPTALVPNRDIGIGVRGDVVGNRLSYYVGVSNGTPDGGSVTDDADDSKTATWRLMATPFKKSPLWSGLAVGIAGTRGDTMGALPSDYRTVGQQVFYAWRKAGGGSTGALVDGSVERLVPQLYWFAGPFGLLAEFAESSQQLTIDGTSGTVENAAHQVSVSWVVTGDPATFRGVVPERPVDAEGRGPGAWQIVLRHTGLTIDDAAFPIFADPLLQAAKATSTGLGVNWYATRQVRFLLDGTRTELEAAAPGVSFRDEKVIILRAQLRW
jgi:phosphate-selective porin OprO/OprP